MLVGMCPAAAAAMRAQVISLNGDRVKAEGSQRGKLTVGGLLLVGVNGQAKPAAGPYRRTAVLHRSDLPVESVTPAVTIGSNAQYRQLRTQPRKHGPLPDLHHGRLPPSQVAREYACCDVTHYDVWFTV
jgi:hypothetical protein